MKNNAILFCFIAIWFASCADNKPAAEIPAIDIEANLFNMEEITLDVLSENIEYICLGYSGYNLTLSMFSSLEFNDSLIMATDLTQCLLYKKNGEFYKKMALSLKSERTFFMSMKMLSRAGKLFVIR
jgi:hypothetical protein